MEPIYSLLPDGMVSNGEGELLAQERQACAVASDKFATFSLKGRVDYQVPYYNINGDKDYQTNYKLAQEYFDEVKSPYKQMFMMENMTHGYLKLYSRYLNNRNGSRQRRFIQQGQS